MKIINVFFNNLATLSQLHSVSSWAVKVLVNDEFSWRYKGAVVIYVRYYPRSCLGKLDDSDEIIVN